MNLDQKLQKKQYDRAWDEFCGFLDLSLSQYMAIQKRLLKEQMEMYYSCELGQRFMKGTLPSSVDEFRERVPLTTYDDYADILLARDIDALPEPPVTWIETTWEGGKRPIKIAPYTASMLACHKGNFITAMMLATSTERNKFTLRKFDKFLYGLAPLPYLTGIVPHVLDGELTVRFLPPVKQAMSMGFSERNREGFKLGMQKGLDLFFGLSSVIARMSEGFASGGSGSFNLFHCTPTMAVKLIRAYIRSKINKTPIMPKDIWKMKAVMCVGTDSCRYKDKIESYWGVRPLEIFGGTEPTIIGTETWSRDGLVLFPDVCFYEFIPQAEYERNIDDPSYVPKTYLMDELVEGELYEMVVTNFKGGAFVRYRAGDIFRCVSLSNVTDKIDFPQFTYVDRAPGVIDIAGFTRITRGTIDNAIVMSKLPIPCWTAVKEYDAEGRPYMHLLMEPGNDGSITPMTVDIIKEHLTIYFKYIDSDYTDVKRMLGIDPLKVTLLPCGTISTFERMAGRKLRRMSPSPFDVTELLKIAKSGKGAPV